MTTKPSVWLPRVGDELQISEILAVKGASLVSPLPKEIQSTNIYTAGFGVSAKNKNATEALIKAIAGPAVAVVLHSNGVEPAAKGNAVWIWKQRRVHSIAASSSPR